MSKKYWSILVFCLMLVTGLAGCGGQGNSASSNSAKPAPSISYRESEIDLKKLERVSNAVLDSQDRLVLYDAAGQNSKFVFLDQQGREIKQVPSPAQASDKDYVDGSVFALDQHDKLYQLQQIDVYDKPHADEPKEYVKRLQIYRPGGVLDKTIELGRMSGGTELHAANMVADDNGRLYILHYRGEIEVIDQAGKPLKNITGAKYRFIDLDEHGELRVIEYSGSEHFLAKLNAAGNTIWKHKLGEIKMGVVGFAYNPHNHCSYVADYSGVKKYDAQGNYQGEVLNYRSTSIFISDVIINSLHIDATGKIYISLLYNGGSSASGKQFSVFEYTPEKASARPQEPQKLVTVGTADEEEALFLEKAARKFQKQHPAIQVEIKDYASGQGNRRDKQHYENYVKALNTEIMSGKGPDIISVQGLPYNKYVDKKVFVDLHSLMKKDKNFKRQDYYTNILKACEHQGKLYAMPVRFFLPAMIADGAMLEKAKLSVDDAHWTWSDFHAAAQKLSQDTNNDGSLETYALPKLDSGQMLDYMLASDYRSFIDEDKKQAHFDSARFVQFLNMYKDLTSKFMNSKIDRETLLFSGSRGSIAFVPDQSFFGDLNMAKCEMGAKATVLAMPQGAGSGDNSFDAVMFAINRKSQMQKESWDFLEFLTSSEEQTSLQLYGMLINRQAQDQIFAAQSKGPTTYATIGSDNGTKTIQQEPLIPQQVARTRQLIAHLNHCNSINPQVKKIIDSEVSSFLKGEKSAAETAKTLQNKVTLNLNE